MHFDRQHRVLRAGNGHRPGSIAWLSSALICLGLLVVSLQASAQNLISNSGFENNPPSGFGNHINYSIAPWTLGTGSQSNVVKVDGGVNFNYGSSGPALDADPATGVGVVQHYLDIASGANDFYQSFVVPICGGSNPGETRQASFSGAFSTRDNLSAATATISIRQGVGGTGSLLATMSASLPAPVPPATSGTAPWVPVSGTVNVVVGTTISYVVAMDNNANFDQGFLSFSGSQCVPAQLTLQKTWSNAAVGDDATITVARSGTVIDTLLSDAGAAGETDVDATPVTVYGGEALTLSETPAGSNTGRYNGALTCSGGGTLSGNTLTVGTSGAAIVCKYTNTREASNLRITKTNTPAVNADIDQASDTVTAGTTTSYSIVVANAGPDNANGAVLRDPAAAGLSCTTLSCGSATNGAVCPTATVAQLQSAAGITIATLPADSSLTFVLGCAVASP